MPTRNLSARLAAIEQTAIVVWQAAQERAPLARPDPPPRPAEGAVLNGLDRVLGAIVDGQVQAVGSIWIMGTWYYELRPWHCTPAESEALYPWCNWIMAVIQNNLPLDGRPNSTAAYAAWIVANRATIARCVAYGADNDN